MGSLRLCAGSQSSENEDGTPAVIELRWEGKALCMQGKLKDGSNMQPTKRYLVGQELVCESSTSGGLLAKRTFTRV